MDIEALARNEGRIRNCCDILWSQYFISWFETYRIQIEKCWLLMLASHADMPTLPQADNRKENWKPLPLFYEHESIAELLWFRWALNVQCLYKQWKNRLLLTNASFHYHECQNRRNLDDLNTLEYCAKERFLNSRSRKRDFRKFFRRPNVSFKLLPWNRP